MARKRKALAMVLVAVLLPLGGSPQGRLTPDANAYEGDPRLERPSQRAHLVRSDEPTIRAAGEVIAGLERFASCEQMADHFKDRLATHVGAWSGGGDVIVDGPMPFALDMPAPAGVDASAAAPAHSTTNVQEAGIDEPDTVKTDGTRILAIVGGDLNLVSVADGEPVPRASVPIGDLGDPRLLLVGNRVLVIGQRWARRTEPFIDESRTEIRTYRIGADHLVEDSTISLDGRFVGARLVEGVLRIVVEASPRIEMTTPDGPSRAAHNRALAENKAAIADAPVSSFLPGYTIVRAGEQAEGKLVACEATARPTEEAGAAHLTVVAIDPADPEPRATTSIVATGSTVYASASHLYVGTSRDDDCGGRLCPALYDPYTQIHAFDIAEAATTRYLDSVRLEGDLKDNWSMSEHDGALRVVTTLGDGSGTRLTVIDLRDERFSVAGVLGGLGKDERVYAVRFIGDLAYVVTFRQIDPLHVIDLSDHSKPTLVGELEMPGYSAYLHPVGDGLLLGVGRDANEDGEVLGEQVSLFDVSDPAAPRRIAHRRIGSWSSVELDPHAFLWWERTGTAVIPITWWNEDANLSGDAAVGIRVRDRSLEEIGRASHPRRAPAVWGWTGMSPITRSLVIGEELFTVSERGILPSDLETFGARTWVPWKTTFTRVDTYADGGSPWSDDDDERRFDAPGQIAVDHRGVMYVVDEGTRSIRVVTSWDSRPVATSRSFDEDDPVDIAIVGGELPAGATPFGVAARPDGSLVASTGCAVWILAEPGAARARWRRLAGAPQPRRCEPGLAVDGAGNLARFGFAMHLASETDGSVLVADEGAHTIRRITIADDGTAAVTTVAGLAGVRGSGDGAGLAARFDRPHSVAVDPDGTILIADAGNDAIRAIRGGVVSTIARGIPEPRAVLYDAVAQTIYAASGAHRVYAIHRGAVSRITGAARGFADGPIADARFDEPSGLGLQADGAVFVADRGNDRIRVITTDRGRGWWCCSVFVTD